MKQLLASLLVLVALLAPVPALAEYNGAFSDVCDSAEAKKTDVCKNQSVKDNPLNSTLANIIDIISVVAGVVSVLIIIYGGFRFITAGGDAAKVATARQTILYALLGLLVIVFSNTIIKFVLNNI